MNITLEFNFKSWSWSELQLKNIAMRRGWWTWGIGTTASYWSSNFLQGFFYQYVHIYVHQWYVILVKCGTNCKKQTCDYSCCRAKHDALHACSISLLFMVFERDLSWFEMTCSVWTVFCCVSQCGFTWHSYFIPEVPGRVFTKFHQMRHYYALCCGFDLCL